MARARTAAREAAARASAPQFTHGIDHDTDLTPPENRVFGWRLEYATPDFRPTVSELVRTADGKHRTVKTQVGHGFYIEIRLSSPDRNGRLGLLVNAQAESPSISYNQSLVFGDACLSGPDLEQFAIGLLAAVHEAKRLHPDMWDGSPTNFRRGAAKASAS